MKKFILLTVLLMCGCKNDKTEVKDDTLTLSDGFVSYKIREVEYKGCEYIIFGQGDSLAVTHKGNCKYCQQRNK